MTTRQANTLTITGTNGFLALDGPQGERLVPIPLAYAAPDLLEALEKLERLARVHKCNYHGPTVCDACDGLARARTAIRQAKGE